MLKLNSTTVFGGVGANPQISALRGGVDVLIACPGRLADHVQQRHAILDAVEITVLDEADHMADMGFLPVVKRLLDQTPKGGQRLLFSATLDNQVSILVQRYLDKPVTHSVDSAQSPVTAMEHHVLHIEADQRLAILTDLAAAPDRTIVFTRTKHGAKKLTRQLIAANIPAVELHGNLAQNARTRNLAAFSTGQATTLVATDIAARGIHVDDVTLVVHADPPTEHKAYLHRSGRTARAGADGMVITLMTDDQQAEVRDLTRKAGVQADHDPDPSGRRPAGPAGHRASGSTARCRSSRPCWRSTAGWTGTVVPKPQVEEAAGRVSGGQVTAGRESPARVRQQGPVPTAVLGPDAGPGHPALVRQPGWSSAGRARVPPVSRPGRAADRHADARSSDGRQSGPKKSERGQGGAKQTGVKQGGSRQGGAKQGGPRQRGSGAQAGRREHRRCPTARPRRAAAVRAVLAPGLSCVRA